MRGAWIEITAARGTSRNAPPSLPVRGAWIEIEDKHGEIVLPRRSPCGERGLKYFRLTHKNGRAKSLPVRGAWIEMIYDKPYFVYQNQSLPVRGAWIEIICRMLERIRSAVAPRAGSVD